MKPNNGPEVLSYHYPGLYNCAGINSEGLAFMWTGSGYYPMTKPVSGLPTYTIIAEIFKKKSVKKALNYLKGIKNAGAFIFFIQDSSGAEAVIEAVPGKIWISQEKTLARANHYESKECINWSKQKLPKKPESTQRRRERIEILKKQSLSFKHIKSIFKDAPDLFCDLPDRLTIDSLIADTKKLKLYYSRGGQYSSGKWHSLGF